MKAAAITAGLVLVAAPAVHARETRPMHEATGRFTIELKPAGEPGAAVSRMRFTKRWTGGIEGAGEGEMLSVGSPAAGNAGYVAMERVTGTLDGRAGGFALQQSGVLDGGKPTMTVQVTPGSGTGALEGLRGEMTIDPAAGHSWRLRYSLPGG